MRDLILVLGAHSQAGRTAARQLRSAHYYCRLMPGELDPEAIVAEDPSGILLTEALPEGTSYEPLLTLGVPVLALGTAAEALLRSFERSNAKGTRRDGVSMFRWQPCALFEGVPDGERRVYGAPAYDVPEELRVIAEADGQPAAFSNDEKKLYLLLMRVERNDPDGTQILLNYASQICGCTPWWTVEGFVGDAVQRIQSAVGDGEAVCAMSGGLDSTVAGMLAHQALGNRAHCVFIDTGLLRDGEAEATSRFFREELGFDFHSVDISDSLMYTMRGLETMDAKWQIASREIEAAIQKTARQFTGVRAVVHGTDAADVLDGGVLGEQRPEGALPILEPLRELFKDEVRRVGETLGLKPEALNRQPFPAIGLAARMSGEVTPGKLKTLRAADTAFTDELRAAGQEKRLSNAYAMLDTVGGACAVILRAVQGQGANAMAARLPCDLLERTVSRIREEMPGVQRVLYDYTPGSEA